MSSPIVDKEYNEERAAIERKALEGKRGSDPQQAKIHDYVVAKSYRPHPALDKLQEVSIKHIRGGMTSPPDSIAILQTLCKLSAAKTAIEVGVYTGYATLGIALALPQGGKVYGLDISEEFKDIGKPFWKEAGVEDKIGLMIGDANESLKTLSQELPVGSLDLAFIDADKQNYYNYYEKLLSMMRPGGVIVVDNVLWSGTVIETENQSEDTKAFQSFNSKLHADDRVTICMLKNSDGITLAVKN